jgi:hypothetical protein
MNKEIENIEKKYRIEIPFKEYKERFPNTWITSKDDDQVTFYNFDKTDPQSIFDFLTNCKGAIQYYEKIDRFNSIYDLSNKQAIKDYLKPLLDKYETEQIKLDDHRIIDFSCRNINDQIIYLRLKNNLYEKFNFQNVTIESFDISNVYADMLFIEFLRNNLETKSEIVTNVVTGLVTNVVTFNYDETDIKEIFLHDYIMDFKEIENRLISENYFDSNGKWIKDKKTELIAFIKILNTYGYFKPKFQKCKGDRQRLLKIRYFFENRYHVDISQEFTPKDRNKIDISGFYHWIKDKR